MTMAVEHILLVKLLGELHALWLPLREPSAPYWAAMWKTRWEYQRAGLPWRGQDDKEKARALAALVAAGWVRRSRGKTKTVGVILTPSGIRHAGSMVGFGPFEAECFTAELLQHAPAGQWVPEITLNDGHGWGDGRSEELLVIETTALQALVLGFVQANCDVLGHVWYRTSPTGVTAVQDWDGRYVESAEPEPDIWNAYHDGLSQGLARLSVMSKLQREIGEMPLPVAMG